MEETEWLPVMEFDGVGYVVDVQNRRSGQLLAPIEIVVFHSDEGREMVRAMVGMASRAWTPRDVWEKQRELMV